MMERNIQACVPTAADPAAEYRESPGAAMERRKTPAVQQTVHRIQERSMKTFGILAACLLFATPALAQTSGGKTGVNTAAGNTMSTTQFVQQVAMSDMYEIQSSQLAAERGDGATKTFANQMISDHQKTSSELKAMAQNGGSTMSAPPAALDQKHQRMLDKLKGLKGAQFNKQYQADQVAAHREAVALFDRYAKSGDNAELKAWAAKTLPTLQQHLQMAQNMSKSQ